MVPESDIKNVPHVSKDDRKLFMIRKFMQRHLSISVVGKHLFPSGVKNFPGSPSGFDLKRPKVKKHGSRSKKSQLNQYKPFLDRKAYMFFIAMQVLGTSFRLFSDLDLSALTESERVSSLPRLPDSDLT